MPSVETFIVAIWIAVLLLVSSTPILVGWEWRRAHHHPPRSGRHQRRRTKRGRHRAPRPSWWARALEAWLANAREAATAYALLRGVRLP